jgi:hypothetical protein
LHRFHSLTKESRMKLGQDWKSELKTSFELNWQTL